MEAVEVLGKLFWALVYALAFILAVRATMNFLRCVFNLVFQGRKPAEEEYGEDKWFT